MDRALRPCRNRKDSTPTAHPHKYMRETVREFASGRPASDGTNHGHDVSAAIFISIAGATAPIDKFFPQD